MATLDLLVTGARGQLGRAVVAAAMARGLAVHGSTSAELPVDDRAAVHAAVAKLRPRRIVHCAAMTNVDGCEQERLVALRTNGLGTAWLAEAAAAHGAGLVYVSTDFVFDGTAHGQPYPVDAAVRPLSVYGLSKRLGEEAVLAHRRADFHVVRTSWVFGPGGKNFPRAILDRARSGQPLKVVTDQHGRPTLTVDLAEALLDVAFGALPGGIWHAANEGHCSWHEFAAEVLRQAGLGQVAVGTQTAAELQRPAPRPAWSVLDTAPLARARGRALPDWRDAVGRWLRLDAAAGQGDAAGSTRTKQY